MATDSSNERKRKTRIVRVFADDQNFWVDLEVLDDGTFDGKQFKGPDTGNQQQMTLLRMDDLFSGNVGSDGVQIDLLPGLDMTAVIETLEFASFMTRQGQKVTRKFVNTTEKNDTRKNHLRRIRSNYISKEFLNDDGEPPENPKDYRDAVSATKDSPGLYLDVYIPKSFVLRRAKGYPEQDIKFEGAWGGGVVNLPGSKTSSDPDRDHVQLDPYQVVINFGPDSLAAVFHGGSK